MDNQPISSQPVVSVPQKPLHKKINIRFAALCLGVVVLCIPLFFLSRPKNKSETQKETSSFSSSIVSSLFEKDSLKKISSKEEFEKVFTQSKQINQSIKLGKTANTARTADTGTFSESAGESVPSRVSETNVQVIGIDEPDIVKTDSSTIFYSKSNQYAQFDLMLNSSMKTAQSPTYLRSSKEIVAVNALPPSGMKEQSVIPTGGEMLIHGKNLVVFGQGPQGGLVIEGYTIANPNIPKKIWEIPFSSQTQKVAARLYKNNIYLVLTTIPSMPHPCPFVITEGTHKIQIGCTDIFIPSSRPASDVVYTTLKIDPATGTINQKMSVVGQSDNPVVYMSTDFLYVNYYAEVDMVTILDQFVSLNRGVFPTYIEDKIKKLIGYDLSSETKEIELGTIFSQYIASLDDDNRLKTENTLKDLMTQFIDKHKRAYTYTGIVKIRLSDLGVQAMGKVPGKLLNQFSLDEWKGTLRVATTINPTSRLGMYGFMNTEQSVSDVYSLDSNLTIQGSVKNLGKTEQIYSVRFIEDRGYVVTFKRTDPLYILDLSNAVSPVLKGELKIPGYSSYLHLLDTHLLLGIGREDSQIKMSLFDVSNASDPKEVDNYKLSDEYWSEALDNHHAFLHDSKYHVFFLPGGRGGYIVSYEANSLDLVKALEMQEVKRALYMNDYLYVVDDSGITSFKEGTWEKAGDVRYSGSTQTISPPVISPTRLLNEDQVSTGSTLLKE